MKYLEVKDPPQWLLDGLLKESTRNTPCPDCKADVGSEHEDECDIAHCLSSDSQRLFCDCGECGRDKWDGSWPGTRKAFEQRLVCFNTQSGKLSFDYNRVIERQQIDQD